MKLLTRKPPAARQPGRHSAEWAAMVKGLVELQKQNRTCKAANAELKAARETDQRRHSHEQQAQAAKFEAELKGWQDALDYAGSEYAKVLNKNALMATAAQLSDELVASLKQQNSMLRTILANLEVDPDGERGISVPPPVDDPESCFAQPDPAPAPYRRIVDIPAGPVGEAADVSAQTQQTDVSGLRAALVPGWPGGEQCVLPVHPLYGQQHRPDGSQATTTRIPLPPTFLVRLAREPAPLIHQPEVCTVAADHAVASVAAATT